MVESEESDVPPSPMPDEYHGREPVVVQAEIDINQPRVFTPVWHVRPDGSEYLA